MALVFSRLVVFGNFQVRHTFSDFTESNINYQTTETLEKDEKQSLKLHVNLC